MTVKIFDRPDIQEFLRELSGLNNDAGNPRMKQIVHRIMSDLFKAIDDLDITPDEYWTGIAWLNDLHKGRHTGEAWSWFIDIFAVACLVFAGTGLFLLLLAAALMVTGPQAMSWLAEWVGLESVMVTIWAWVRWPLAVLMLTAVVAAVYYLAPDVKQEFRFITPGSVLAVVVWIAASLAFGFYAQNFADYNATYGSIGAIIDRKVIGTAKSSGQSAGTKLPAVAPT